MILLACGESAVNNNNGSNILGNNYSGLNT